MKQLANYIIPFAIIICLLYIYFSRQNNPSITIEFDHVWPAETDVAGFTLPSVELDGKKIDMVWKYQLLPGGGRILKTEKIEAKRGQHFIRLVGNLVWRSPTGDRAEYYAPLNPNGTESTYEIKVPRRGAVIIYNIESLVQGSVNVGNSALEIILERRLNEPPEP